MREKEIDSEKKKRKRQRNPAEGFRKGLETPHLSREETVPPRRREEPADEPVGDVKLAYKTDDLMKVDRTNSRRKMKKKILSLMKQIKLSPRIYEPNFVSSWLMGL